MGRTYRFSRVTNEYLNEFDEILDKMICSMTNVQLCDSISRNFIMQMIPHHMAAIEMSRNILKYTTNLKIQCIADSIISEQTESIANMTEVEGRCGMVCNHKNALSAYQDKINCIINVMFDEMKNACSTNCINCNFMREMIPHHRGAIRMSESALKYDICPELKPILKSIIVSQKKGVKDMYRLLQCLNCK